jgi:hypothetical protein
MRPQQRYPLQLLGTIPSLTVCWVLWWGASAMHLFLGLPVAGLGLLIWVLCWMLWPHFYVDPSEMLLPIGDKRQQLLLLQH